MALDWLLGKIYSIGQYNFKNPMRLSENKSKVEIVKRLIWETIFDSAKISLFTIFTISTFLFLFYSTSDYFDNDQGLDQFFNSNIVPSNQSSGLGVCCCAQMAYKLVQTS